MGFYRWLNGVRIQGHPQGLKTSVNHVLEAQTTGLVIQKGTVAFYQVDPVDHVEEERE